MTCANCPQPAAVHVSYGSAGIEPAVATLCHACSFELHQDMLWHLLKLDGWIVETPLEGASA
jgi:hypothetical protein